MENNIFYELKDLVIIVTISRFAIRDFDRTLEGELLEVSNEYIKMRVKDKVVFVKQEYIVKVEPQ